MSKNRKRDISFDAKLDQIARMKAAREELDKKKYRGHDPARKEKFDEKIAQEKEILDMALEKVNHPQHYGGDTPHEVYKCLREWGLEKDALIWNAVTYLARYAKKHDMVTMQIEDLKKAIWYIQCRIEEMKE